MIVKGEDEKEELDGQVRGGGDKRRKAGTIHRIRT